jgi:hypothetical protein
MGKKSRSGCGTNIPDHISKSLETTFLGLKILKFFDAEYFDPDVGSGIEKFGSGIEKFGSGILHKHPRSATLKICIRHCIM